MHILKRIKGTGRQIMKRWMQGIGLIYILLLLGICVPGAAGGNAQNDTGETLYLIRSERTKKETDKNGKAEDRPDL